MCFQFYNESVTGGKIATTLNYAMRARGHTASQCTRCGKCEQHCPQSIAIRDQLAATTKALEGLLYRPMRFIVKRMFKKVD